MGGERGLEDQRSHKRYRRYVGIPAPQTSVEELVSGAFGLVERRIHQFYRKYPARCRDESASLCIHKNPTNADKFNLKNYYYSPAMANLSNELLYVGEIDDTKEKQDERSPPWSSQEPIELEEARDRLEETRQEIERIRTQLCFSEPIPQHLEYADHLDNVSTRIETLEDSIADFQRELPPQNRRLQSYCRKDTVAADS